MRTGAVIQARTSSTRLPGKVLKELPCGSGVTVLERIVERLRPAATIDEIVVATSDQSDDDRVAGIARACGVPCYRGPLDDVLGRYLGAAEEYGLDRVVRITADCPCVDATVVDAVVELHESSGAQFATNVLPRSYPKGLDVEVADRSTLRTVNVEADSPFDREHVFTYVYGDGLGRFRTANLTAPAELTDPDLRVTLDTPADYAFLAGVYDLLGPAFDTADIFQLLRQRPWLRLIQLLRP